MIIYDDLLGEYLDENGKVVYGTPEVTLEKQNGEWQITEEKVVVSDYELEKIKEKIAGVEKSIQALENQIKALKETETMVKTKLLGIMQQQQIDKVEVGNVTITRVKASERTTIDTKRLKAEMPEIAKMFEQTTKIEESLRIKIGGNKNEDSKY